MYVATCGICKKPLAWALVKGASKWAHRHEDLEAVRINWHPPKPTRVKRVDSRSR